MALPKLNDSPKYEMTIPSLQTKVKFRPYLVKEEKILMIAMESGSQKSTVNAIIDTIMACVEGEFDRKSLTSYDIEYMFLNLRSKSVGERTTITIQCQKCESHNDNEIDLSKVAVSKATLEKSIQITEDINLHMKYPNFTAVMEVANDGNEETEIERTFKLISECMDVLETEDGRFDLKDETEEEIQEFLESLSSQQFEKIRDWLQDIPKLKHEITFECSECQHKNDVVLQGLDDFF
mgnify:FL=1|tara:strand:- start:1505 stop:2215 length:711 start_codon:yes stop_codon:yes gene_type:complete